MPKVIRLHDPTSHGGQAVACKDDLVSCPKDCLNLNICGLRNIRF